MIREQSKNANLVVLLLDIQDLIINTDSKTISVKKEKHTELLGRDLNPTKTLIVLNKVDNRLDLLTSPLEDHALILNDVKFPITGAISCRKEFAINELIELLTKRVLKKEA